MNTGRHDDSPPRLASAHPGDVDGEIEPGLAGAYVFGDFCDGRIRLAAIQSDGSVATRLTDLVVPLLASFAEDASGEVYALSLTGGVFRLDAG